ncbi:cytochrome c, class I [Halomonas campisalis]|uniref:Cytochrome c, class I n=1 Tax=Billgrantia campisalis TaxID=74661 RepID=A0ABS9PAB5_9GAMM|nr:c-type cytochrome [Halomonas campisalis]MCG6658207.1 cytochrome c, class I [Halomonas campisalis]MDR5862875.1 cytochrome c, class I [Halomonas campisalis]
MKRVFHRMSAGLMGALLLAGVTPALADDAFSPAQLEVMAGGCANCHGTDGRLSGNVPAIAGRPAELLASRLLAFKHESVPDTTIMDRIARGFTDEELTALAQHFADIYPK